VICALVWGLTAVAGEGGGGLGVEAGTDITIGQFTFQDATVDISEEFFNPRVSVEYGFSKPRISLGVAYAASENNYSLEFDDGEETLDGDVDVERTDLIGFVRFGRRDGMNLRLGVRRFEYELSNAQLDEFENGAQTKQIRNGTAGGELTTGIDAELNLVFGTGVQFGLTLGGSYFMDAQYAWQYQDMLAGGAWTSGTAELDAVSLRIAPELTVPLADGLRLYVNYTISGTSWIGNEDDEGEDYAGVDVMTAVGVGFRYWFGD
jgi:hypothetical protein